MTGELGILGMNVDCLSNSNENDEEYAQQRHRNRTAVPYRSCTY